MADQFSILVLSGSPMSCPDAAPGQRVNLAVLDRTGRTWPVWPW
jgi:hypothetical protein